VNTELIQKLKSQCIVREVRGTDAFDNYMVDRFDTEKFAELIVRECDRYARSAWEHGTLLGRDLLIHFGVVEIKDEQ
jgi:hypothetical protein